jgi:hypothetical protein
MRCLEDESMMRHATGIGRNVLSRHGTVAAYLALLLASSTATYAAATIGSPEVINNSLQSVDLKDGAAVTGADIVNESVLGADVNEASLSGVGRKLLFSANAGTGKTNIATVAGYTFKATCENPDIGNGLFATMWVKGPAGDYQYFLSHRVNDQGDVGMESGGEVLAASTDSRLFALGVDHLQYRRATFQFWLHSGATVLLVDVHAFADNRSSGACTIYGMVTKGV